MAEIKRALRINWWKVAIVIGLILWFVAMYLDGTHLSPESPLTNRWFVLGLMIIIFMFTGSVFIWMAKIRSGKVSHCHGSDTWDPSEWHVIPAITLEDGRIVTPRLLVRGVGGFKAMGIYLGGKGAKGWDVVVDFPGIWERHGPNLVIRTDTKETFVGAYEHRDIANIIDRMNNYLLGIPGMISIADDTPINVFAIPKEREGISDDVLQHFATLNEAERLYSKRLGQERATNLDLRMKLEEERGASHGSGTWQTATRPKGVENTGANQPETQ